MGTIQEYETLVHYAIKYHPDLVILAFFIQNDASGNIPELANYDWPPFYRMNRSGELEYVPAKIPPELKNRFRTYIREHLRIALFFSDRIRRHPSLEKFFIRIGLLIDTHIHTAKMNSIPTNFFVYKKEYDKIWEEAWDITLKMLVKMKSFCEKEKMGLFVFNIPSDMPMRGGAEKYFRMYPRMKEYEWDFLKPHKLLEDFCERENIAYIDLIGPLEEYYQKTKRPLFFKYDGHFNSEGMELTAEIVFKEIVNKGLVPIDKKVLHK